MSPGRRTILLEVMQSMSVRSFGAIILFLKTQIEPIIRRFNHHLFGKVQFSRLIKPNTTMTVSKDSVVGWARETILPHSVNGWLNLLEQGDDDHLGALDVGDERHAEVDGHSARAIPVRGQAEGRDSSSATDPHGKVNDQVKHLVAQVVGHRDHLARDVDLLLKTVNYSQRIFLLLTNYLWTSQSLFRQF